MFSADDDSTTKVATNIFDNQRVSTEQKIRTNNIFFEDIAVTQGDLTVSFITTGKLEDDLILMKRKLGIVVIVLRGLKSFVLCIRAHIC